MKITFNELRKIKDSLPDGSMQQIAQSLSIPVETVRNYFGGANYRAGEGMGNHYEPGPQGGFVDLEDPAIFNLAVQILEQETASM